MNRKLSLLALILVLSIRIFSQIQNPVSWTFELNKTSATTADIKVQANIEEGWHIYGLNIPKDGPNPTTIVFEKIENAQKTGDLQALSKLEKQFSAEFNMEINWYSETAVFIQKIKFTDASKVKVNGHVRFMACDDKSCLPPTNKPFSLALNSTPGNPVITTPVVQNKPDSATKTPDYWKPVINELKSFGNKAETDNSTSLWLIFLAGLAGGFLALFTPCVWPIIPMTVSFFLKRAENKKRGRRDAILYGLAIIFIYVTLGILITLLFGASALNSLSTNAVFNLLFFGLLLLFAISFFGAFEITLPSAWSTKLDAKADSTAGFVSILLMAFTLVLVSFSCTGPIIGTLLVQVSVSGSVLAPAIGMLGFAVALSVPFSLFALFPSWLKSLPKSGGWLNKVKVVLAFLELALAFKFLSVADLAYGWHILDREVFVSIWIVIFALLGMYLIGKIRFPHDNESKHTSVSGIFLGILSFAFSVYMIPGLWGAPLKAISAFAPPLYTQDFNMYKGEVHPTFTDYDLGMAYAAEKKMPVVIDFSGFGCVNCRKMEATVWTDPNVNELLKKEFVLISLFVDDKTTLAKPYQVQVNGTSISIETIGDKWSYLQSSKFGANAQPFYVMLDAEGNPLNSPYTFDSSPEKFLNWLKRKK